MFKVYKHPEYLLFHKLVFYKIQLYNHKKKLQKYNKHNNLTRKKINPMKIKVHQIQKRQKI